MELGMRAKWSSSLVEVGGLAKPRSWILPGKAAKSPFRRGRRATSRRRRKRPTPWEPKRSGTGGYDEYGGYRAPRQHDSGDFFGGVDILVNNVGGSRGGANLGHHG